MAIPRILHYPGSKWSMADWIISHMPQHKTYLEPFFGSGAVFFRKETSLLETINDIDSNIINLFKVIRDYPEKLAEKVHWTPLSREEYYKSFEANPEDEIERARVFLVRCGQAIGAKTSDRTGWRSNINPLNHHKAKEWNNLPEKILSVADRLKNVQIEHQDASQLIKRYNRPEVFIYADPPYVLRTRSKRMYAHEFSDADHAILIGYLKKHAGPVLLSGYDNELYNDLLNDWQKETFEAFAETGSKRTEVLWINPVAAETGCYQEKLF
ncbi:DNA adenine methylase [Heyndrickxia oleronia]|uniref:site-specific DNA-methyltransferase (adenine-specific) n=1 Tax=Heyndrickxia oleronia TaxID=38875 RepID=A0AAW6SU63_9BACI|nr:DNA adenine methylase [Heyndrickxia oleronia]MDH5160366.1 DNA adenine methylase [Heyndrickxia oleronia]